jgi:hypothetical protein
MRVFGILATVAVISGCGGSGRAAMKPAFATGTEVRISDGGQIYDALNTTNCVRWPSADVKKKAGRAEWKDFNPGTGNEGKVLAALAHCDGKTQVVLVAIGDYVVPVTSKGVEAKDQPGATAQDELVGVGDFGGLGYGGLGYGGYDIYGEGSWDEGGVVGGVVGGYGAGTFVAGDTVEIINAGEIFTDANQSDCFTWPSDDVKKKGGQDQWGSYYPVEGDVGVVLHVTKRCGDDVEVLILDIGGYVVPIKSNSVAPIY